MKKLSLSLFLLGALSMNPFYSKAQDFSDYQELNLREQMAPKDNDNSDDLPPPPPFTLAGDNKQLNSFNAFPNPGNGELTLQLIDGSEVEVTVLDLSGTVHFQKKAVPNSKYQLKLNLNAAPTGIYLIRVNDYCFKYQKW